jgi:lysophospholipase L1-like esterase
MNPTVAQLFALVLTLIGPAPKDTPRFFRLKPGDSIVAIGDSITQAGGYLRATDAVLATRYPDMNIPPITNVGISGQKAEDLVLRFEKDVVEKKPAVVTISIGINDVWHRLENPHDDEVLKNYKANVTKMVEQAQAASIRVILLAPTLIQEAPESEGNKRLKMYVDAEKEIAAEKKCQFVNLHETFLEALKKKPAEEKGNWLTSDGVHMKPLGDTIMAVGILRALGVPDAKIAAKAE